MPFVFTGKIDKVTIELKPKQPPGNQPDLKRGYFPGVESVFTRS